MKKFINTGIALLLLLTAIISFSACGDSDASPPEEEMRSLDEIIQVGEQRALNRLNIDWDELRTEMFDTYEQEGFDAAVRVYLSALGDNQSFYGRLTGINIFASEANCSGTEFSFAGLPDDVGYIQMRTFVGRQAEATLFAGDRHNRARTQDDANIKGWVVDLTTTTGGDIYPVIASLGMFYDRETLGFFTNSDESIPWGFTEEGAFVRSTGEIQTPVDDPYTLMNPQDKVVVVIDVATAGAGEAATIALKDRPNTLVLGRPTCGLTTVTQSFSLSNSDFIVIATHYISDSDEEVFPGRLQPDEQVGNSTDLMNRITEWLNE